MNNSPTLIIGTQKFEMTKFYLEGATAYRKGLNSWDNPYNDGTQRFQDWDWGYENEEAGEHIRYDLDLVVNCTPGEVYAEDSNLKRDENGYLIRTS